MSRPAESLDLFKSSPAIGLAETDIASTAGLKIINGFITNYVYEVKDFISTNKVKGYRDNTEWENIAYGNILLELLEAQTRAEKVFGEKQEARAECPMFHCLKRTLQVDIKYGQEPAKGHTLSDHRVNLYGCSSH